MGGLAEPLLVTLLVVLGAWTGLARIEPDPHIRARTGGFAGIAAVAGLAAGLGALLAPATALAGWVPPLFAAQLAVAAWIDRQTTWVPDPVLFGLCLLALLAAGGEVGSPSRLAIEHMFGGDPRPLFPLSPLLALLLAGIAALAWRLQAALDLGRITPPDLVAFALPVLVFGLSGKGALAYALTAAVAALILWLPGARAVFVHPAAAAEGARDLDLAGGLPVPALMLVLPAVAAVYFLAP